jgi:hypothetical protein
LIPIRLQPSITFLSLFILMHFYPDTHRQGDKHHDCAIVFCRASSIFINLKRNSFSLIAVPPCHPASVQPGMLPPPC